jgi:hypothetical protein
LKFGEELNCKQDNWKKTALLSGHKQFSTTESFITSLNGILFLQEVVQHKAAVQLVEPVQTLRFITSAAVDEGYAFTVIRGTVSE